MLFFRSQIIISHLNLNSELTLKRIIVPTNEHGEKLCIQVCFFRAKSGATDNHRNGSCNKSNKGPLSWDFKKKCPN